MRNSNLKSIILIRHGESEGNVDVNTYLTKPDSKILLTENGKEQALELGRSMKSPVREGRVLTGVYVSPYERAKETYKKFREGYGEEAFASTFDMPRLDDRLREREWGDYARYTPEQISAIKERNGEYFYRIENGESVADCTGRVSSFLNTLYQDGFEKAVLFSHGDFIKAFVTRFFRRKPEWFEENKVIDNATFVNIYFSGDQWLCQYHNSFLSSKARGYEI